MRRRTGLACGVAALFGIAGIACSTLEPKNTPAECISDAECSDGTVCDFGICRDPSGEAPIRYLGFDLQEVAGAGGSQFRVELTGCDKEVDRRDLTLNRTQATQTLQLAAFVVDPVDRENPTMEELLAATFVVSAPSRFARDPPRRSVPHPTVNADLSISPTSLRWPRYDLDDQLPNDLGQRGTILWELQPTATEENGPARASRFLVLAPPVADDDPEVECTQDLDCCPPDAEECTPEDVEDTCVQALGICRVYGNPLRLYDYVYQDACNRTFDGQVVRVDENLNVVGGIGGARVSVRHADRAGEPPLGLGPYPPIPSEDQVPECSKNEDCGSATKFCNLDTAQCETALAGLLAWSGTSFEDSELPQPPNLQPGDFSAAVFTYCAGPEDALTRAFNVSVVPPENSALPAMTYEFPVVFDPTQSGQTPDADLGGKALCVPDWGEPIAVEFALRGQPTELVEGAYTCCDLDCLPRTRADAMTVSTSPPSVCNGSAGGTAPVVRVETPFILEPAQALLWLASDSPCVATPNDAPGVVGTLRRTASCAANTSNGGCKVDFVAGSPDVPRTYTVRIEPPTGSVLGSRETTIEVGNDSGGEGSTTASIDLPARTLVRGFVTLGAGVCEVEDETDGDCGSEGATVLAERLRMPGESVGNTLGPYFHEVSTFHDPRTGRGRDGAYILPLDPGVWVLTALPNSGTPGGPAPIILLDLRDETMGEVEQDFNLGPGILVTLDVRSFDRRTQVVPLDIGSWALDGLRHPARLDEPDPANQLVDLGAPEECFSSAEGGAALGCRIRRLIGGTSLPPTQVGQVRFTARDLGRPEALDCTTPAP